MKKQHLIHLYHRAGFGIKPSELYQLEKISLKKNIALLWQKSETIPKMKMDFSTLKKLTQEKDKPAINKESQKLIKQLNNDWYQILNSSESVLRNKMTLFWMNHFVAANPIKSKMVLEYHKILQKNALGNFKNFVLEVSKSPLMINYLNNQQNRKNKPNENFARELMELFTLGEGNYTEQSIKASARAFTGWTIRKKQFFFNEKQHDFGQKTFFGVTGDLNGEDIIDIILKQKTCAAFICTKLYKYFVNPTINQNHINLMTDRFYKDYDIGELMKYVFTSDWFYDSDNIGVKIKSPAELLVGLHQYLPYKFRKQKTFYYLQFSLGQKLFFPPNVAGWPGNRHWIDANTIMVRLKLASALAQEKNIPLAEEHAFEDDFSTINNRKNEKKTRKYADIDWVKFHTSTKNTTHQELQNILISGKISNASKDMLTKAVNQNTKDFCITCMSLPEYQMC